MQVKQLLKSYNSLELKDKFSVLQLLYFAKKLGLCFFFIIVGPKVFISLIEQTKPVFQKLVISITVSQPESNTLRDITLIYEIYSYPDQPDLAFIQIDPVLNPNCFLSAGIFQ